MIHEWFTCIMIILIITSIGSYLLKSKIIQFEIDWLEYIYYYGLGVLAWYPCNYIVKK